MQKKTFVLDAAERAGRIRKLAAEAEKVMAETDQVRASPMVPDVSAPTPVPAAIPELA